MTNGPIHSLSSPYSTSDTIKASCRSSRQCYLQPKRLLSPPSGTGALSGDKSKEPQSHWARKCELFPYSVSTRCDSSRLAGVQRCRSVQIQREHRTLPVSRGQGRAQRSVQHRRLRSSHRSTRTCSGCWGSQPVPWGWVNARNRWDPAATCCHRVTHTGAPYAVPWQPSTAGNENCMRKESNGDHCTSLG